MSSYFYVVIESEFTMVSIRNSKKPAKYFEKSKNYKLLLISAKLESFYLKRFWVLLSFLIDKAVKLLKILSITKGTVGKVLSFWMNLKSKIIIKNCQSVVITVF